MRVCWGGGEERGVNLNSNVYGVCKYFIIIGIYFFKLCYFFKIKKILNLNVKVY